MVLSFLFAESIGIFESVHREYEGYDGWYNNQAHPDWGGAGRYSNLVSKDTLSVSPEKNVITVFTP